MKRYFKYVFLTLILGIMVMSCVEEIDAPQTMPASDQFTLVPRVTNFANQYVTKAAYGTSETKITKLAVLVFDNDKNLVHIEKAENNSGLTSLTLNKSLLNQNNVTSATVVMIANMDLKNVKKADGTTLEANKSTITLAGLNDYSFHFDEAQAVVTSLGNSFTGFPMVGTTEGLNLSSSVDHVDALQVNLQILYAKINFSISVAEGTENQNYEGVTPSFALTSYTVNNVSKETAYTAPAEGVATASASYAYQTVGKSVEGSSTSFTFYMAETRYQHGGFDGVYPDASWTTSTLYNDYKQQYKPKLAVNGTGQPATGLAAYVTLVGTYTDYRGTQWAVNYKVYLGKDNYQNFEVDRNSEYTNILTIKGIRNNDAFDTGQVWFDHRVNVSTNALAGNVKITRETLIDSHIEVRPLRVKWDENAFVGVRVYLPTDSKGNLVNWIGIERFTDENCQEATTYCYQNGKSIGKRKYFTTTLISELQSKGGEFGVKDDNGAKYIYLLNGECAWIYFDENTTSGDRPAEITLSFYPEEGDPVNEVYRITQRGLQTVAGYAIESYEEYLHSYDSADKYNLSTSPVDYTQQGLIWGPTKMFSDSVIVSASPLPTGHSLVSQRYDYYHKSDIPSGNSYYSYFNDGAWTQIVTGEGYRSSDYAAGTGLDFTNRAAAFKGGFTIKDMGSMPESAYQYCLSKNKFKEDADGNNTLDIHWYLPDVYQLKSVLTASQSGDYSVVDLSSDVYYWSSQPSYDGIIGEGTLGLANEVPENARAVSSAGVNDLSRTSQHRIRCFYDATGVTTDMSNRTPEGIGGNYSFIMKSYSDKNKSAIGYFNYMLSAVQTANESKTTNYQYNNSSYPYPTFANPGGDFGYFSDIVDNSNNLVSGFLKNPIDQSNWNEYSYTILGKTINTGYYYTLAPSTFPGLSLYTLEQYLSGSTGIDAWKPTSTRKSDTKIVYSRTVDKLQSNLSSENLNTLDHLIGGSMLSISFSNGNNASNSPKYDYIECTSGEEITTMRYWQVPSYVSATYTPKAESNTKTYTATATGTGTGSNYLGDKGMASATTAAEEKALEAAKNMAHSEFPNRTYSYGTPSYTHKDKGYTSSWGITTYTMEATCTIQITSTASSSPVTYYQDATGGGWDSGSSVSKSLVGINTDELRMCCGNSFTISVNDPNYVISKVKVYYSGDSFVSSPSTGDNVYSRFVDSTVTLPKEATISKSGSSETLQLPGMDYHDDTDAGSGTHQWSGDGRASVTLTLADYYVNNNILDNSYTYRYATASSDFSQYIIIDKIEVKCTPKATSSSTTE